MGVGGTALMTQGRDDSSLEQPGVGRERGETSWLILEKDWRWVREDGAKTFYLSKRLSCCSVSLDSWVFSFFCFEGRGLHFKDGYIGSHTLAGDQSQATPPNNPPPPPPKLLCFGDLGWFQ